MSRPLQVAAILLAAAAVCGPVMAIHLPALIRDWKRAVAESTPRATATQARPRHPRGDRRPAGPVDEGRNRSGRRAPDARSRAHPIAGAAVLAAGTAALLAAVLAALRLQARRTRDYALYELHLSMHDEARPDDMRAMVEAIANLVRRPPEQRVVRGQPYLCLELHYGPANHGHAWTLAVRCEPAIAAALDGVIAAAYPDVRLGHAHHDSPRPLRARLTEPGCVLRYRKARPFIHPLCPDPEPQRTPPLETIALQQVRLGRPLLGAHAADPGATGARDVRALAPAPP